MVTKAEREREMGEGSKQPQSQKEKNGSILSLSTFKRNY
jgi:hypothetical protein